MDISYLRTLIAVAKFKNLTKAGIALGLSPSAVGRHMQALERDLKKKLFLGYPTGVQLTIEGEELARSAQDICNSYDQAIANAHNKREELSGYISLMASNGGIIWFSQYLEEFHDLYPNITLEISRYSCATLHYMSALPGSFVSLLGLPKPPSDTMVVWQELVPYYWYPFAHKIYLEQYGEPKTYQELD